MFAVCVFLLAILCVENNTDSEVRKENCRVIEQAYEIITSETSKPFFANIKAKLGVEDIKNIEDFERVLREDTSTAKSGNISINTKNVYCNCYLDSNTFLFDLIRTWKDAESKRKEIERRIAINRDP